MSDELLASYRRHIDRMAVLIRAPMSRPDIRVTIIVRAPEALPAEAMVSSNDDLGVVLDAVRHFAGEVKNGSV